MCGRKLRESLLCFLVFVPLCLLPCFAEISLTDEEAQTMLNEIEESKKDLQTLKSKLETSKNEASELQKESNEQKKQLEVLQDISNEQKESYEKQLKEVRKKNLIAWTLTGVSSTGCTILIILVLVALV